MTVQRYDYAEFKATITDEGFLKDSPVVGRIGIQEYLQPDGKIRRELRLPEEVFNADALASMAGKPITVDHPKDGKVTSKSAHRVTVGAMLAEGKQDGDHLRADIVIHSPDAIGERRQLSLGYKADMDETPGVWNGQAYDAIQRNIRVNHLSVVKTARAGSIARLNMDSNEEDFSTTQEQHTMTVKVKLDNGLEYDAAPEVSAELAKLRKDASDAATKLDAIPKLEAERDTLKAKVDSFAEELAKAKEEGKAQAQARVKLDAEAARLKVDTKDKTDSEVKQAVIQAVTPALNLDGKSEDYINAAYDIAIATKGDKAMEKQRIDASEKNEGGVKTSAQARDGMINKITNKESK